VPPNNRGNAIGRVDIPEASDVQRSREILDELYRRSGERSRSQDERDYIQRLLRWY
jgi:RNA polymerase-interacting CarD/CdnL/TRCF family regulator